MGSYAPLGNGGRVVGDLAKISSIRAHKRIIARAPWGIGDREPAHSRPAATEWSRARGGAAERAHHRGHPALSLDLPDPGGRKLVGRRLRDEAAQGSPAGRPCPGSTLFEQDLQGDLSRARGLASKLW